MSSRKQPNGPQEKPNVVYQFTDSWDRLARGIREIHKKNSWYISPEELYRNAYYMVLHKNGDKLYNGVREVITQHLEEVVISQVVPAFPLSGASSSQTNPNGADGANFLKVLKTVWEDHTTCMLMIKNILVYMDRVYARNANVPLIYDLGLDLFRDIIVRSPNYPIQTHLLEALLQQIKLERENEIIDRTNVKAVIDMLLELTDASTKDTIYATDFENKLLEASSEYYRVEGQMLVGEYDTSEYMKEEPFRIYFYLLLLRDPKYIIINRKQPNGEIRPQEKPNAVYQFTDSWDSLAQAIREIHKKNASILSFEGLYRDTISMVHHNGDKLYNGVREIITQHLEEVAVSQVVPAFPLSSASSSQTNPNGAGRANFLKVLKTVWEDHITCMLMLSDILKYMDRVYARNANVPLVYDLGLDLFRDIIVRSPNYPIQTHLLEALLQQIKLERENEIIDRTNVKAVIDMLLELTDASTKNTIYAIDFENKFLESSSEYYRVEGQMLVGEYDTSEYMKEVDKRLNKEEQRVGHYLSPTTEPKIRNIVEEELISKHFKTVIEKSLIPVLRNEKMDDLGRMYKLFGRVVKGHDEMKSAISDYIRELGKAINETAEGSNAASGDKQTEVTVALRWVQKVLDLKDKFDRVQNLALSNDKAFQTSFNEAFEYFIDKNPKSSEFITLFLYDHYTKGLKREENDNMLNKAITLFRFIVRSRAVINLSQN